jgi:protease-4
VFSFKRRPPIVALMTVSGTLTDASVMAQFRLLRQLATLGRPVAGLLLRVASPGGSLAAAQALAEQLAQLRDETGAQVFTVADDMAASAAFHLLLHGDRVFAQPAAVLGSVGAQVERYDITPLMQSLGVRDLSATSAGNKRAYDRVLTRLPAAGPAAQAAPYTARQPFDVADELVADIHAQFVAAVCRLRPAVAADAALLDGRLFSGRAALQGGLVDELGGTPSALAALVRSTVIERFELITLEPSRGFDPLGMLLSSLPFGRLLGRLLGRGE